MIIWSSCLNHSKKNEAKNLYLEDLIKFKKFRRMQQKDYEIRSFRNKKIDESVDFESDETKDLFEFDD